MKGKGKTIEMNDIWTQTGTMDILIYLLEKQQGILSDFTYGMRKNALTMTRAIDKLMQAKFIKEERGDHNSRMFTLTKIGFQMADLAKQQKELFEQTKINLSRKDSLTL